MWEDFFYPDMDGYPFIGMSLKHKLQSAVAEQFYDIFHIQKKVLSSEDLCHPDFFYNYVRV